MKIIKPNSPIQVIDGISIFLAGTIDNGKSIDWQMEMESILKDYNVTLLNPRRDNWNPNSSRDEMIKQINWEMDNLDKCDVIFMNILEESLSPITLLELGLYANSGKMIVSCHEEFWRKINVDVVCDRFNIPRYDNFDDAITKLKSQYSFLYNNNVL
jgi:nucleoside 2-deoxyribosyltransferase